MALWQVMAELTARGLQVNLAAWYPWQAPCEAVTRMDSTAMFIIGPLVGCRKVYDESAIDLRGDGSEGLLADWKLMEQNVEDEDGNHHREKTAKFELYQKCRGSSTIEEARENASS